MKNSITPAIVFMLLIFASQLFSQETFSLKYKLEKGKTYLYRTVYTAEMSREMNGQEMTSNGEGKLKLRMVVADVSDEKMEIITSRDSMYSRISNPMGGEDIISNGEEMVGKRAKLIYNNYGKKLGVVVVDSAKNAQGNIIAPSSAMFVQLGDKPVKIGEEWTVTTCDTNKIGEAGISITNNETKYKAESKDIINGVAYLKISLKSVVKSETSMSVQGMSVVSEKTDNTTGAILFDLTGGMIYSYETQSDSNLVTTLIEQNRTMPSTQKMKTLVLYIGNN